MRSLGWVIIAALAVVLAVPGTAWPGAENSERIARQDATVLVAYRSEAALDSALRSYPARIVSRLPELRVAEVRPSLPVARFAASVRALPGIDGVHRPRDREQAGEPAVAAPAGAIPYQWQWYATRSHLVPEWALRAAAGVTIAVVDTGADLTAPDLADKAPQGFDVATASADVEDTHGHGTFVASLAAGSVSNGEGIAGSAGDARLLVVRAVAGTDRFTDVDGARGIIAAVERGARIVNLSFGGPRTSLTERRAVDFAASRGVLLIAAAGNDGRLGSPVQYPAALLQLQSSKGVGGVGLAVAASNRKGSRAAFSNRGSWISLAAPGAGVFGALASLSSTMLYPRVALPGSTAGHYGYGNGTSYSAPQVAGAAAIVWGANPGLTAAEVAKILKQSASGRGRWTPGLGYGVVDVAAALELATGVATDSREASAASERLDVEFP